MANRTERPPERGKLLYKNLFGGADTDDTLGMISAGILAIIRNVEALLSDAQILANAKRYERAEFLAATAREEIGKVYILLDMCRVDFRKHESILRRLCYIFYSHEYKHAYFELSTHKYPGIATLAELKNAFEIETRLWWPARSIEDGEPDMPHDVFFRREANLYVDFDEYAQQWHTPAMPSKAHFFEGPEWLSPLNEALKAMEQLHRAERLGLFQPAALNALNSHFSRQVFNRLSDVTTLAKTYVAVAKKLEAQGTSTNDFNESPLYNWPLYFCLH